LLLLPPLLLLLLACCMPPSLPHTPRHSPVSPPLLLLCLRLQAVAWRVTPGGRSLIDRRRRSRVERNVRLVVEHLELECKVPFGEWAAAQRAVPEQYKSRQVHSGTARANCCL
jgi:hypothetical protein